MRLLHLIYDHMGNPWVGGGGAVRVYELSKRLSAMGHEVTVISGRYPNAKDYEEGRLKYKFAGISSGYLLSTFSYACGAASFVRKHSREYDIVIEDFAPWNPVFSSLLTKKPVILHVNHREGIGIIKRWLLLGIPFYLVEAIYPALFKNLTALSEGTKKKLERPDAKVIPAGVAPMTIPDVQEKCSPCVIYVGRLHIKNKGLDTLFEAMKEVRVSGGKVKLVLVGRGRDEAKLKAISGGIDAEFRGFLSEEGKFSAMAGADVFVLPSRFEGWGIVVLEAALCGKPVVVSDIPELSFAVEGGFGVSFRTGDAGDLKDKLDMLLNDPALREKMGERAKEYVKGYSWDKIAEDYEKFLIKTASGS